MSDESENSGEEDIEKVKSERNDGQKRMKSGEDKEENNAKEKIKILDDISLISDESEILEPKDKSTPKVPLAKDLPMKNIHVNSLSANVAHRCEKCKSQLKVPLKDFQRCLVCYKIYHKACLGVDAKSNFNYFTCDGCSKKLEDIRHGRKRENEMKKRKINVEKMETQKKISGDENVQDELVWYITNREKFERAREKYELSFSQEIPVKSSRVQSSINKVEERPVNESPFNAATTMEKIMMEMCRNQANALRRQAEIDERERVRVLPHVKSLGAEWITFYRAYQNSKNFFEDQENVVRLQAAISCPDVLKKGGTNLFCTETYDETIEEINKSMNNSKRLVSDGAEKLRKLKSPKDHIHDHKVLIDFIIEIRHFANLLQKVGDVGSQNDSRLIATLASRLPWNLRANWQEKCYAKELQGDAITVMFLSKFLQQKLGGLERAQTEENMVIWQDEKNINRLTQRDTKSAKLFAHNSEKQAWEFRCWIDKSDDHNIKDCPTSKTMSGKECFELAKQLKVCTGCGKEKFIGKCSRSTPPPPCSQHPGQNHWRTVCPNRPALKMQNSSDGQTQVIENGESENEGNTEEDRSSESNEVQLNSHQASNSRIIDPRFYLNLTNSHLNTTRHVALNNTIVH